MIYANENDPHASHWLSCLPLQFDLIDNRSIADVKGDEIRKFSQCHFFAGIGGWPYALELAQWPISVPVWTGSCPCQPFSVAGQRKGAADKEKALWPEFRRLIAECRPAVIFGEQVASKDGRLWFTGIRSDLEALGYAVGSADLCAAGVGAPHIRQRLYWVAYSASSSGPKHEREPRYGTRRFSSEENAAIAAGDSMRLGDSEGNRWEQGWAESNRGDTTAADSGLGYPTSIGGGGGIRRESRESTQDRSGMLTGSEHWSGIEYIECRDGKARPVKPGVRLLAHGVPGRVAQLRRLGNAIVPQVAATFIAAFMDSIWPED